MSQAAKFGDLVLGIDTHLVLVPGVASPVPLVHPFIGVVFDPLGAALSAALGPVLINGSPAANAGTDIVGRPHFPMPPGASFAPDDVPDNEGTIVSGSKTVSMAGTSAGRLGSLAATCNYPLNLPTSMCFAVPFGAPVLVGGPDAFDVTAAVTRGVRTKWFSNQLHKVLKAKPGSRLSKTICFLTGHPVDVMTGEVLTDAVDFELSGPLPIVFERNYWSRSTVEGPLGPGWSHPLDLWVREVATGLEVRLPDGRVRWHEPLAPGDARWDDLDRYTLARTERGYSLTTWDGLAYVFEPIPRAPVSYALVRIHDRCRNEIACRYAEGRLLEVIDSAGRVLRFDTEGGRLRAVRVRRRQAGDGWIELARYDYEDGRLAAAADAEGHALRYAYEGGVLVRETNRNGLSFHFEYDWHHPAGHCIRTWGDGGLYERRITYDEHRHVTVVDDGRGGRTHYYGNALGLVDREIDPTGRETRYAWDEHAHKLSEADGLGNRTAWEYDAWGNAVLERDALGHETRRTFNAQHLPVEIADPAGGMWRRRYDARGKLVEATDPLGSTTRFEHDRRGNLVAVEDARGQRIALRYDGRCALVGATGWEGGVTRWEHDDLGRPILEVDARGAETRLEWDVCGRLERVVRPDGSEVRLARDPEGNVVERIDAGRITRCRYAGMNKLVEHVDPEGGVARLSYDVEESLVGVTNEVGETYRIEVDRAGRVVKEIGFDGRTLELWYDRAGRTSEVVGGAGQRTKIERDAAGRIVTLRVPTPPPQGKVLPGVEEIAYGWDARGLLVRAKNDAAEVLLSRDALGRVVREQVGDAVIETEHDAAGERIRRRTSLGHEAAYDVDGNGALRGLAFGLDPRFHDFAPEVLRMGGPPVRAPWKATFARDALGAETERRMPGGLVGQWQRDRMGRPAVHRVLRDALQLVAIGYVYGGPDEIAELLDPHGGPTTFTHDARSYLVSATWPDGTEQHRMPDAVGNLFRSPDRLDRAYGTGGRLLLEGGIEHRCDADGQLVEKRLPDGRSWRYRWDALGQLAGVTRPDGKEVTFAYDALGRRIRKTFGGRTTTYVWDGDDLVHEVADGAPLVTWELEPEAFAPVAKVEGERRYSVVTDHLGAPRMLFDEAGEVAWKARLDLYGAADVEVERTRCPWRWPGQYHDEETGLFYNRFRYYDPALGRYLSQDPIGLAGGTELYAYTHDPLSWIDPLGLVFGIYMFTDKIRRLPYIGSSVDTHRRFGEHIRAKRLGARIDATEIPVDVFGAEGRDAVRLLRLAEQRAIKDARDQGKVLANKINAVGPRRRFYEALERWYIGGQKGLKPTCKG